MKTKQYHLSLSVAIFVVFVLGFMKIMMDEPMLIFDRFLTGAGWLQIAILALYGAFLVFKMKDPGESAKWRLRSWLLFSIVFFTQFGLGIIADERFLMTGKLHLPAPFMIIAGPVYRGQMTIMPILLLSSIILSGPAWCSQYCYFGAWDGLASRRKTQDVRLKKGDREAIKNKWVWKWSFLLLVMVSAIIFRLAGFSGWQTLGPALGLALIGVLTMVLISRRSKKMFHCSVFCPIGTLVNFGKYISPFRMSIESSCTACMKCIPSCRYDALNIKDIKNNKPGITCTMCGDCISSCEVNSIRYHFLKMTPAASRNLYLFITISLHVLCLGLARM